MQLEQGISAGNGTESVRDRIPVFGLIMVIFFIMQVSLTKQRCNEIRKTLEERRGKV